MKAFVDRDICIGCEGCVGICPDVFSMDDEGKSVPVITDIPENEIESANDAMENCPVGAITIE
ncbi:ferredoxin [Romboutsia sp. 1001216sp1]|uniref:ferredoxin n=1 Tax=Romboutsia sp. 1001216sp1 TaxID=2986997 RepID=UPI002330B9CA|nr:ferredoxin [Romboutsia sp. 1001216sp1]MDB8804759.1 ferredoxin [Romboutsia sp. 1001216sp1]MDB8809106.1 ferredoxin [Romboutsia sp. 1001216sp1]MDB8810405.1 ferredoxin [Romboutsia sp. 1001216sp1]MDB8816124.1 ferredoxin [Romboutsia sp. 1001216sp1]MDB8818922.1 ferredoxin [Romboutsia sp. 1001216sp1]